MIMILNSAIKNEFVILTPYNGAICGAENRGDNNIWQYI